MPSLQYPQRHHSAEGPVPVFTYGFLRDHLQPARLLLCPACAQLPGWNYVEVVVGSNLHFIPLFFFFFFFFVGQGGGSAAETMKDQRGEMVSRLPQLIVLWSGAPSSGTACSLELSLPSPAGIWFKTPLPVGGTNTAASVIKGRDGLLAPSEYSDTPRLQRPGVWGSPSVRATEEYPLNLRGASCST